MVGKSIEDLLADFSDEDNKRLVLEAVSALRAKIVETATQVLMQAEDMDDLREEIEDHLDTIAYLKDKISQIVEESADKAMDEIESYYHDN